MAAIARPTDNWAMRHPELDDRAPGRRQNWWTAAIVLLFAAFACVSAGFWYGAGAVSVAALVVLVISFSVKP